MFLCSHQEKQFAFDPHLLNEKLAADPALQEELRQSPQATIECIMNLPTGALAGCDFQIVDLKPNTLVIPVPMFEEEVRLPEETSATARASGEISEENLEEVSGGTKSTLQSNPNFREKFWDIVR